MPRYIDADALTAEFKRLTLGENSLIERIFADGVYAVIDTFPTADVVPKSEVAREIFEEIESVLFHTLVVPTVTAIGIIENKKIDGLHIRIEDYNTIKKKYTEDKT